MYDGFFVHAARVPNEQEYRVRRKSEKLLFVTVLEDKEELGVIYFLHNTLIFLDHFNGPSERSFKAVCTISANMIEE